MWAFYCSAMVFAVSRISTTLCFCFAHAFVYIPWNLINLSYGVHLIALLLILFARLRSVFGETVYRLHSRSMHGLTVTILLVFAAGLVLVFLIATGDDDVDLFWALSGVLIIVVLILAQVLAWLFVYKLLQIRKNSASSSDMKLRETVRKYSVLSVISVTFTTLAALIVIVTSTTGYGSPLVSELFATFIVL